MPGIMHEVMGLTAWRSLSESDRAAWALSPAIPAWAPEFLRGQTVASVEAKIARYSLFLDLMGWRMREFLRTPEFLLYGHIPVPHGGATRDLRPTWCAEALYDPWACREVLRAFVPRLIDQVRRGEMEEAAMTGAGVLAHYIEDMAAVTHGVPNSFIYDIMPTEEGAHHNYHPVIDEVTMDLETTAPLLLGTGVEEVICRLGARLDRNYKRALRGMIPLLEAVRRNDVALMRNLLRPCYQDAVESLASLLHTAMALGGSSLDVTETEGLSTFDLTTAVPWWVHPGRGYGPQAPVGCSLVEGRQAPLVTDLGTGPICIERGLGMTSFVSPRYILEPGAFRYFTGAVGLSATCLSDQVSGMDVEFFISLSPEWETQVVSDLEFAPPLRKVWSHRLESGRPALPIDVDLGDARTLLFGVLPHPSMVNGRERYYSPHVVIVEPRLVKL